MVDLGDGKTEFARYEGEEEDDRKGDKGDIIKQGERVKGQNGGGFFDRHEISGGDKIVDKDEEITEGIKGQVA